MIIFMASDDTEKIERSRIKDISKIKVVDNGLDSLQYPQLDEADKKILKRYAQDITRRLEIVLPMNEIKSNLYNAVQTMLNDSQEKVDILRANSEGDLEINLLCNRYNNLHEQFRKKGFK